METRIRLSENARQVVNAGIDLILDKVENDNICWNDSDKETVKTAMDIIGVQTDYFWYNVEVERKSNLDSRIENLDSKP